MAVNSSRIGMVTNSHYKYWLVLVGEDRRLEQILDERLTINNFGILCVFMTTAFLTFSNQGQLLYIFLTLIIDYAGKEDI